MESRHQVRTGGLLIALAGALAYADALRGPFIYDDMGSIVDNPSIRRAATALLPPQGHGWTVEGRPVLNASFAANHLFGGTEVVGYHVANVAIHVMAGLVLYGLVRRLRVLPLAGACAAALLWTVHPLQTESVTYVVQRAESLMGFFYLVTLYGLVRGAESPAKGRRWLALSWLACLLGCGTKEVMVTAPVMALCLDRAFLAGSFAAAWRTRRTYYLALFGTWLVLAGLVLGAGGNRSGSAGFGAGIPWGDYLLTQPRAIVRYLVLAVWPSPLVFDYGAARDSWSVAGPCLLLVAALGGASLWALVRAPRWGFLGLFYFGILAITSLVPGSSETIVEHRIYLPLAAVVVAAVVLLGRLPGRTGVIAAFVLAAPLAVATATRNRDYRSAYRLWSDSVAKHPESSRAHYNLGVTLFDLGRPAEEIAAYREALRLDPKNVEAHHSLANALFHAGAASEALTEFAAAERLAPRDARLRYDHGTVLLQAGDLNAAEAMLQDSLRLDPANAEAHDNLGVVRAREGRFDDAIPEFQAALRVSPELFRAHANWGNALMQSGRFQEAAAEFQRALAMAPDNPALRRALGAALEAGSRQK